jgi:hypothetical protein
VFPMSSCGRYLASSEFLSTLQTPHFFATSHILDLYFQGQPSSFMYFSYPLHVPIFKMQFKTISSCQQLFPGAGLFHFFLPPVLCYIYVSLLSLMLFSFIVHYVYHHQSFKQLMIPTLPSSPPTIPPPHARFSLPSQRGLATYLVPPSTFLSTPVFP